MRSVAGEGIADVAICMWTTFNYLSHGDEVRRFFDTVHRLLRDNGVLVVDTKNYANPGELAYSRETVSNCYKLSLMVNKSLRDGINEAIYDYEITDLETGGIVRMRDQELAWVYSLSDILDASKSLFELCEAFGDYSVGEKFDRSNSNRLITVLRKAG
jgi:hypothetical protein